MTKQKRSTLSNFDRYLKQRIHDLMTGPPDMRPNRGDGYSCEWARIRAPLKDCRCGCIAKDLHIQCAQLGSTAWVCCVECKLGFYGHGGPDITHGEQGSDSRPEAVRKWNEYMGANP